jgi:hypothetical protein
MATAEDDDEINAGGNEDDEQASQNLLEKQLWKEVELDLSLKLIENKTKVKKIDFPVVEEDESNHPTLVKDVQDLTIHLVNELSCPEMLPHRQFEELRFQNRQRLETLPETERLDNMEKLLYEMECNRIEYELAELNRCRIRKLSKFPQYFLEKQKEMLSEEEILFARSYLKLKKSYLSDVCLGRLPDVFQSPDRELQSEPFTSVDAEDSIIPTPNLRTFVVFKALKDLGGEIYPGTYVGVNQTYACPYILIRQHLMDGDVRLLCE